MLIESIAFIIDLTCPTQFEEIITRLENDDTEDNLPPIPKKIWDNWIVAIYLELKKEFELPESLVSLRGQIDYLTLKFKTEEK